MRFYSHVSRFMAAIRLRTHRTKPVEALRTSHGLPIDIRISRCWFLADVRIGFAPGLCVGEGRSAAMRGDIVWNEDGGGDRAPQIARLLEIATRTAAGALRGPRGVRMELTVLRFKALTPAAEAQIRISGSHEFALMAQVVDALTGEVLVGRTPIEARISAPTGCEAKAARLNGMTPKAAIGSHVARVLAGWLGTGPDMRMAPEPVQTKPRRAAVIALI